MLVKNVQLGANLSFQLNVLCIEKVIKKSKNGEEKGKANNNESFDLVFN